MARGNGRTPAGLGAVIAVLLLAALWWWSESGSGNDASVRPDERAASSQQTDPDSGLPLIAEQDLPAEAAAVLADIDAGGPYEYAQDNSTFGNYEGVLPAHDRGFYREYTVETPGLGHRGARRIVVGGGRYFYWTEDHYESFARIRR